MIDTNQISAIRKHAPTFTQSLRKAGLELDHIEPHALSWQDLNRVERDARAAAKATIDRVADGTDERRAAEIENAFDGLTALADACAGDKDARTARGDRGPWAGVDLGRRPKGQAGSTGCGDFGSDDAAPAYALRSGQPMRAWAQARGIEDESIGAGALLRALVTGAKTDREQRALAGGTDAAGGFTVPTTTSAELIDLARRNMVLDAAGARTIALDTSETIIARLASDPTPAWRVENAAVATGDPTFSAVTLKPQSIAVLVKASVELMSDSINLEAELPNIMARALAVEIDRAGLIGSGTAPEPRGIVNFAGLTANAYAGGALASYAPILTARGALHGANERLGAVVMASRDENTLAGLVASDGQPLQMPRALDGVRMLHTTALPTNGGVGENESQIICGDFEQMLIGVRTGIRVEILRERFMDNLQFGLVCHARIDFAAARPGAFTVLDGVVPAT